MTDPRREYDALRAWIEHIRDTLDYGIARHDTQCIGDAYFAALAALRGEDLADWEAEAK